MKTVAFIPIKMNSQRLPHKNILPLGDKPLCWHIANIALQCKEIDEVFVFCSDETILEYLPSKIKFLKRDAKLDMDETKGLEIYRSFVDLVHSDIYVLMHATSPFQQPEDVDDALNKVKSGEYDSAFSVERVQTFVWFDKKPLNYNPQDVPRTQEIKPVFVETSGFYIFTKPIIDQGRRIGTRPYIKEVGFKEAIDIDTKEDYDHACALLNQN